MIKIGVIGAGKWGLNHIKAFSELDCELVGVADPVEKTGELAEKYGIVHVKDYRDLLPQVDAVSVAAPTDLHHRIVKDCLMSGKHVIVEKPMTLESKTSEELADTADEKGLVLAVGHLFRFNSAVLRLKDEMKNAGDLDYITMRYIHSTNPPRTDSGTVFNFGIHLLDVLDFVLERSPEKISCKTVSHISKEREDCAFMLADYGDFVASLEMSWLHPLKKRDIWVIGSKEKIYADLLEQTMTKYMIEISRNAIKNTGSAGIGIEKNEPLTDELRHFIECIELKRTPVNNGRIGCRIVRQCEAALRSAKTGAEVAL
ncbi:MAG TPA: Gfo/Idh/MocA family oxidoreductase [Candidatus Methanoperedenaceae archaeon]|nr:Gfo/Idh/MocA family oxidoreductase [Candidatus Methanoperedenaceae archaeon]